MRFDRIFGTEHGVELRLRGTEIKIHVGIGIRMEMKIGSRDNELRLGLRGACHLGVWHIQSLTSRDTAVTHDLHSVSESLYDLQATASTRRPSSPGHERRRREGD